MIVIKGKSVCGSIAFGRINQIRKDNSLIRKTHIKDVIKEIKRFEAAIAESKKQLKELYNKALSEVGSDNAKIFEIHQLMLDDKDYIDGILSAIKEQKINAEAAVAVISDNFSEMFSAMDDSYMKARASDVSDISERIISNLSGKRGEIYNSIDATIICARDLAPSETVQLDKNKILGFVTEKGSKNSHTSILARTMNVPSIISANGIMNEEYNGCEAILDGINGLIYINPDAKTIEKLKNEKELRDKNEELLNELKGLPAQSIDGKRIMLYANISDVSDIPQVFKNNADGVGLFRSEFLYLGRDDFPTEEEQFAIYKDAAEKMCGKRLIIRTMDIGADKKIDYFNLPEEENPALGFRAIRISLKREDIFKAQLRALLRASCFGKLAIMFPMITSVDEVKKIKALYNHVKEELRKEKLPYREDIELGIMIETPAAAMISDILAKEVDFFSVGTNDLIQYTLAMDRQNVNIEEFCDNHHIAVLRLIKKTIDNSHKYGKWTGICGELAGDLSLTEIFLLMGVDELSVTPGSIPGVKEKIIKTDLTKFDKDFLNNFLEVTS